MSTKEEDPNHSKTTVDNAFFSLRLKFLIKKLPRPFISRNCSREKFLLLTFRRELEKLVEILYESFGKLN